MQSSKMIPVRQHRNPYQQVPVQRFASINQKLNVLEFYKLLPQSESSKIDGKLEFEVIELTSSNGNI